jgi:radical SAM enzyme (TIGR01210 family)
MDDSPERIATSQILAAREPKQAVDPWRPYAFLSERELSAEGEIVDVATLFLTNRECPLRCLMCDLWQHTTDDTVPLGAIPTQIEYALERLPAATQIKLYNSGNFFDPKAIPPDDHAAIARLLDGFERVIVENHPKLCSDDCLRFRDRLSGSLEIALGLETIHPQVLTMLNKQMTVADFDRAAEFLIENGIDVRCFLLLRPPYLNEEEGVDWALRSIEHAFNVGVTCCSVIPTRSGNGILDQMERDGLFAPPSVRSMERVVAEGIALGRGRVFVDLWDAERFAKCDDCRSERIDRLRRMNLSQRDEPAVLCRCQAA